MIPRPEYPRPSFVKGDWLNLNGTWEFEIDQGDSGIHRGLLKRSLASRITVPFCPESRLSGIENTDFLHAVWYRRVVELPPAWKGRRILLHFQAVECDATVYIDGAECYTHRGGFTPFTVDLGTQPRDAITIVLRARAPLFLHPRGKQSDHYETYGCRYTRTTGIWQTVWLEAVPEVYLRRPRITPQRGTRSFLVEAPISANRDGLAVRAALLADGQPVATAQASASLDFCPALTLTVPDAHYREWCPEDPYLYQVRLELLDTDGNVLESALCTAGMRSVTIDGNRLLLNGRPVFQRLVLDQGHYPDGILTAPSDEALVNDIRLAMAAGFNGARLHEKVFEERFLHHADRLGYLVWGEFGDWGFERSDTLPAAPAAVCQAGATLITQWLEALDRDYSHPSIIGWCALNETGQDYTSPADTINALDDITRGAFLAAKAADRTRPVLDSSGYSHRVREADVFDTHDYEQDPAKFAAHYRDLHDNAAYCHAAHRNVPYNGQPFFNSEFGGIRWAPDFANGRQSWGYGTPPTSLEEFYHRFEGLVNALLDHPDMFGYCYTQLTDVFIEQNGIYFFDRTPKFDVDRLKRIQQRAAAYEKA